jgi:cupin fold WbuC family metalloprotein|tara:strand:- start:2589 stop:3011 length:423 start_codon:yes stop_codon:yes gene_type:complete
MENKNEIEKIYHNNELIASIVRPLESQEGLTFLTEDENYIQLGIWNYKKDTVLPAHYHTEFSRESFKTNEVVYVVKGNIECNLYTENGELIKKVTINEQELIVQFNGAHEYIINEDSLIIETKNGPYFGPDIDRVRIETK